MKASRGAAVFGEKHGMPGRSSRSPRFLRVGGPVDSVHASVTFNGPTLDPDALTAALRCRPSAAHARGQTHLIRGVPHPWSAGHWSLDAGPWKKEELSDAIDRVLRRIRADPAAVRKISSQFGGRVFCGISVETWNRGFGLPPSTLARLVAFGLSLGFDIYASNPDQVDWTTSLKSKSRRTRG